MVACTLVGYFAVGFVVTVCWINKLLVGLDYEFVLLLFSFGFAGIVLLALILLFWCLLLSCCSLFAGFDLGLLFVATLEWVV